MKLNLFKRENIRYPRLDTVLMVEKFIMEHDGEYRKKQLLGFLY